MLSYWLKSAFSLTQPLHNFTAIRLFSRTSISLALPKNDDHLRSKTSDEVRREKKRLANKRYKEAQILRMEEDADYAAKVKEMRELTKEKRRKLERENPEYLTRRRELEYARQSRLYRDESGKKHRMARREYDRQRPRDPEVLLRMRMYERERGQDDEKYHKMRFPTWVKRRTKTLKLQWKTHQPVEFDEKVEKQCVTCQRFRDMKFWCVIVSLFLFVCYIFYHFSCKLC